MSSPPNYRAYRFPPEIISHAAWLYHRKLCGEGRFRTLVATQAVPDATGFDADVKIRARA